MVGPTAFADLNAVLSKLVGCARSTLAENFSGAYLHGSFATGDADAFSDVDWVVATHDELTHEQQAGLQAMHRRIYVLETPWAQHLEGSYAPKARLRRVERSPSPFFYLDNGSDQLVWDRHCNSAVVRWLLRERALVLAGPEPRTLVDPVSASELRGEGAASVHEYTAWAPQPTAAGSMSRWKQPYLVLAHAPICRLRRHHSDAPGRESPGGTARSLSRLQNDVGRLVVAGQLSRDHPAVRVEVAQVVRCGEANDGLAVADRRGRPACRP